MNKRRTREQVYVPRNGLSAFHMYWGGFVCKAIDGWPYICLRVIHAQKLNNHYYCSLLRFCVFLFALRCYIISL